MSVINKIGVIYRMPKQVLIATMCWFGNRYAALLSFILLPFLVCNAQGIQSVQKSFDAYQQDTQQEKVFVHTDKNTYLPGEIMWFKIYCVDANTNKPLNLSKVVYVEILDKNNSPIVQEKISMNNGAGSGSIYLPVAVPNGIYLFRAYTNWMKNFSPDSYFEKQVTLINPLMQVDLPVQESAPKYDFQFFPEGGNLVSGVTSKVAFKCVNRYGKGVQVRGAIIGKQNDTVARFSALKFGMGSFSFTPVANVTYKAVIKVGNEPPFTKKLPEIIDQGYVMKLTDDGAGQLNVTVSTKGNSDKPVFLIAHTRQAIKMAEKGTLVNGISHFIIPQKSLGEGVSHVTIFDSDQQPVCERLYFKKPARQVIINATPNLPQYGKRKKVTIDMAIQDQLGKPVEGDMSMAVYRVDSLQLTDPDNIFNYLWLTSELQGHVESPDYYFTDSTATALAADNLMLTQGWTRFKWSQLLANNKQVFTYLPEYDDHIINAKIINTVTNAPAKGILTYLSVPGKRIQLYTAKSDSVGNLRYSTRQLFGNNELILQTNTRVDSTYRIEVLMPFSTQYSKNALPQFSVYPAWLPALKEHSIATQALNIYDGADIKRFIAPLIDTAAFYGKNIKVYKLDDFTRFNTMEENLREYVKETYVSKIKGKFSIEVFTENGFLEKRDPLIMFDGVPVFDLNKAFSINPLKVKKLEVKANRYLYGLAIFEGVLSFTTYKADLNGVELDPRAIILDYDGLQLQREFYSPVYDTEEKVTSRKPDFRNLLFWTPRINKTGINAVSFYTADQAGDYIGVIQGITTNGHPASQYLTFKVK